ncbi:hypothetical protein SE17_17535, partial [Kouleothrix aurantiaca]
GGDGARFLRRAMGPSFIITGLGYIAVSGAPSPALAWLGRRMAIWGSSIEARYTPVALGPCEGC